MERNYMDLRSTENRNRNNKQKNLPSLEITADLSRKYKSDLKYYSSFP